MFNVGDYVQIKGTSKKGIIYRIAKNSDIQKTKYYIKIYNSGISVTSDQIEISNLDINILNRASVTYSLNTIDDFSNEIMLRHQTVDEALFNLDKFIDSAICNKEKRIKIIHGKNGGILRNAVHKYLNMDNRVKNHELAQVFEGSYGATIAYLK